MENTAPSPVKPPEENHNPGQEGIDDLTEREFNPDEYQRRHETAADDSSDPRGDEEHSKRQEEPSGDPSDPRSELSEAEQASSTTTGQPSYYKKVSEKPGLRARLNGSKNLKRYLIFGGIGASIIAIIILLLSFLSIFKLDGLMSNIEQRAFLRHNASLNTRSSKYISAYVEARMMDWGDNPDLSKNENTLFRSARVDTNSPFSDWYRTMRTSNFEQEVFEKHGIKFTSAVGADGKARLGKIDINGEKPIDVSISNADLIAIQNGDIQVLNRYQSYFDLDKFNDNKDARKAIKDVVNANTHWSQAYRRRFLRKDLQNMTGVTDWRFFETTRDKVRDKRIDIRNRMLDKMLPNDALLARVVRCMYGLTNCKPNSDVASPDDRVSTADFTDRDRPSDNTSQQNDTEAKLAAARLDEAGISDALKKILVQANIFAKILNIPQTLDMLSFVNQNVGSLVKLVVVARGAQATGLFQVFETSRDQIKTGQVNSAEVNAFMENIDTAASSSGWTQVISGDGAPPGTAINGGACSQEAQALEEKNPNAFQKQYGSFAPLCADQQIGDAANAQKIQDEYHNTIGQVIGPIAGAWGGVKSVPILGTVINVLEKFTNILNGLVSTVVGTVLKSLWLQDNVQSAFAWIFAKTSNFLGITILKGYESGGTTFNWLVQGGAYTSESASRMEGAALTNPASQAASQSSIAQYQTDKNDEASLYDKVASLDNPNSLAFKGATALSGAQSDPSSAIMSGLHNLLSGLGKNTASIFGGHLLAATPDGYSASKFASIQTYDYPQQCYDLDPLTETPLDGTNAVSVLRQAGISISSDDMDKLSSWDVETNSDTFYDTLYSIIPDTVQSPDDIATHIYNCNLLDTVTRGSLGYLYGYTKGNGL
jgi:hypothetical protein